MTDGFSMKIHFIALTVIICELLFLVTSCTHNKPILQQFAPLPEDTLCRIAILPFANSSKYPNADLIVNRIFSAELVKTGSFQLVPEGDIWKVYQQLMIYPTQQPRLEQLRIISDRLDAQLLIMGTIFELSEKTDGKAVNPILVLKLQLLEADSGKTLWLTHLRREGKQYRKVMHFGLINTITELIRICSNEILELWYANGLKKCTN